MPVKITERIIKTTLKAIILQFKFFAKIQQKGDTTAKLIVIAFI
jgi:hypothetical protein